MANGYDMKKYITLTRRAFLDRGLRIAVASPQIGLLTALLDVGNKPSRLLPVAINDEWGYIDTSGKLKLPLKYSFAECFSEGLAMAAPLLQDDVSKETLYGFIDDCGEWVVPPIFKWANDFWGGHTFAELSQSKDTVILSRSGKIVACLNSCRITCLADGPLFPAEIIVNGNKLGGYIDKRGQPVIGFRFKRVSGFWDCLAEVSCDAGTGFIDMAGNWAIKPIQGIVADGFFENLCACKVGGKAGYINKHGEWIIPPKYYKAKRFSQGLAAIKSHRDSKWGFIDITGRMVIPEVLGFATIFFEGLAAAIDVRKKRWGYIDRNGEWIIEPLFTGATHFKNGFASVKLGNVQTYINEDGHIVWWPHMGDLNSTTPTSLDLYLSL